jgi:RNA polymerase primary sigma factor
MNEKLTKIVKISNRLYQECEREPTVEEIAKEINISPEFIEQIVHHFNDTMSMDTLIEEGRENGSTLSFNQKRNPILDRVISSSLSQTLHVILTELPIREREVIKLRFGIGGCDYHTLEEIGVKFDVTRERSRQILENGLKKMKKSKHMIQLKDFSEYQMM